MFCHKCGNELPKGSDFCPKCGAKLVFDEVVAQAPSEPVTAVTQKSILTSAESVPEFQQAPSNNTIAPATVSRSLRMVAMSGRVILGISLLMLFFFSINPIVLVVGVAVGIILSALGLRRPLGITKIIELTVAVILLIVVIVSAVSYGGDGVGIGSSTGGNRIVIGETQIVANALGNLEVTLDYVEFIPYIISELWGDIFPDEGHIFLWAEFTLRNIGTTSGALMTAWTNVVYDGMYEFGIYTLDGTHGISPLTTSTGILVFMVPNVVAESNNSLAISFGDIYGSSPMSFVIRPGENVDSQSVITDEILFDGKPVLTWLGSRLVYLHDEFGPPDIEGVVGEGGVDGYVYGSWDVVFVNAYDGDYIDSIYGRPAFLTLNGATLNQNRDGLIALFGAPYHEDWINNYGIDIYYITFIYQEAYSISFDLSTPDSNANQIWVSYWWP